MNLSEFKAWFEGFTENLDGAPNTKAWKRICDKVKTITPDPLPVFVERYRPYYPNWVYWNGIGHGIGHGIGLGIGLGYQSLGMHSGNLQQAQCQNMQFSGNAVGMNDAVQMSYTEGLNGWSASDAFRDLGRMDAQTIT